MAYLLLILCVYVAAVLDTSLGEMLAVRGVSPDLVALVAVTWVLLARDRWAFLAGGMVALLGDLISPGRVGVGAAWMLLVGFGLGWLPPRVPGRGLAVRLTLVTAAMMVWCLGVAATVSALGTAAMPFPRQLAAALGAALYTSAVAVPILMVVGWVQTNRNDRL